MRGLCQCPQPGNTHFYTATATLTTIRIMRRECVNALNRATPIST